VIRKHHQLTLIIALAITPVLFACGRKAEEDRVDTAPPATLPSATENMRVTDVDLGNAIDADKKIAGNEDDEFKPSDVIYAVVKTEGNGSNAALTARWTFEDGQTVEETTQTISPTGPATTEFHVSKPSGWPEGKYKVEILLNGASAKTEEFKVKK
jgi:hypothetical protein